MISCGQAILEPRHVVKGDEINVRILRVRMLLKYKQCTHTLSTMHISRRSEDLPRQGEVFPSGTLTRLTTNHMLRTHPHFTLGGKRKLPRGDMSRYAHARVLYARI